MNFEKEKKIAYLPTQLTKVVREIANQLYFKGWL
jgi:hypothetical protein